MSTSRLSFLVLLGAAASLSACNSTPADSTATTAAAVVREDSTRRDSVPTMPAAVPSTEYTAPNTVVTNSADSLHKE